MENQKEISKALAVFHKEVVSIKKESENPYFKSSYAGLDSILPAIKEPLSKAGLVFVQIPTGENGLLTRIIHADSGEFIQGEYSMRPVKDDPQGRGSCLTYMRRYALVAMLGLNTEDDDDGNKASANIKTTKTAKNNDKEFFKDILPEKTNEIL